MATLSELPAYAALDQHAKAQARSLPLARDILFAIDRAGRGIVDRLATADAETRRIADSYRAFRGQTATPSSPAA